jgi:UDP-GlcNAc:undecaprenyl-phosphate GlcNAc-1-phosphate transferase
MATLTAPVLLTLSILPRLTVSRGSLFLVAVVALVLAAAFTPMVRALARRLGVVARPKADRWHSKPTAMMGGLGIMAAFSLVFLALIRPEGAQYWSIFAASLAMFAIGLVDDLLNIKPYQKLIGQVICSAFVIYFNVTLPWTSSALLNMAITLFWLIGITNAINLLDNMDGLAAGVAAIAATCLAINFALDQLVSPALMMATFAAVLVGFLIYNSNPASIFMGDCGSMFIGFLLASTSLLSGSGVQSRSFLPVVAVPVLILLIPIFDTTFVTLLRKLGGRSASQGGRDHTSHRLVALGVSERFAVWLLYGFAMLSGALALVTRGMHLDLSLAMIVMFTLGLTIVGVYLAQVKVTYPDPGKGQKTALVSFLIDLGYKRRLFEVLLDVALITLSYYAAYALIFGPYSKSGDWQMFLLTLPVVVCSNLAAFLVMGVYRGLWRYVTFDNMFTFAKAVVAGSAGSVLAVLFLFRFAGFSRAVFVLAALLLMIGLAASRGAFRLFRQLLPRGRRDDGVRVLIYGAGDAGMLLLRELSNNRDLAYVPVGFVDDDQHKERKTIGGLRVYPGRDLVATCERLQVAEVILSTSKFTPEQIARVAELCDEAERPLKRMAIHLEPVRVPVHTSPATIVSTAFDAEPTVAQQRAAEAVVNVYRQNARAVRTSGSTHVFDNVWSDTARYAGPIESADN